MYKYIVQKKHLKRFLACLLVLTIITGICLITPLSITFVYADDTEPQNNSNNGVVLNKTATYADGVATIKLEAYATGEKVIKQQTFVIPSDIVLVLDVSNSMNSHVGYKYTSANLTNRTLLGKNNQYYISDNNSYYLITSITKDSNIESDNTVYTYTYTDSNGTSKTQTSKGCHTKPSFVYSFVEDTGSPTRLAALQQSAIAFVNSVIDKSENTNNRVAIVTFGTNAEYRTGTNATNALKNMNIKSEADDVIEKIQGLTTSGATKPAEGLTLAKNIFNAYPIADGVSRNRVVVFFTDGTPGTTDGKWDSTSTDRANDAVNVSNTLKNDYGATVYAVGIFAGADGSSPGTAYTSSTSSTNATVVAKYGNYFMQHVSANGTLPANGISGYYFSAANSESLSSIFTEIAQQIEEGGSSTTLNESAKIRDTISPYFTVPDNANGVTLQTANYIGEDDWDTPVATPSGVTASVDDKGLIVTGFNFSDNWCGTTTNGNNVEYRGKKLIITFKVEVDSNYLGGSDTPTNGSDSGIYDEDGDKDGNFPLPTVDVPLKTIQPVITGTDDEWNIYLTTEKEISKNFENLEFTIDNNKVNFGTMFNGTNNADVNVSFVLKKGNEEINTFTILKGGTAGSWKFDMPALSDDTYTIECIVDDAGDVAEQDKLLSTMGQANIKINVFKPVLTFSDKNVYYGGSQVNWSSVQPTVEWKCGDKLDSSVSKMHTDKPILTYEYSGVTGTTVNQTDDYIVKLETVTANNVNLLDENYNGAVTFKRNCETESLSGENSDKDNAFKIHVYLPTVKFEDTSAYYGEQVTLKNYSDDIEWTNSNGKTAPTAMDNNKPALTMTTSGDTNKINDKGYIIDKNDIPVKATIKMGNQDVTQTLISAGRLTRTCATDDEHTSVTKDAAYYIHVKTVSLSVEKKIEGRFADKSGTFSFNVTITLAADTGLKPITETFNLVNNQEKELPELPKGAAFKIEETDVLNGYTVSFKVNDENPILQANKTFEGTLSADTTKVVVTNTLDKVPQTSIDDGNLLLEYGIILFAGIGLISLVIFARRKNNKYCGKYSA